MNTDPIVRLGSSPPPPSPLVSSKLDRRRRGKLRNEREVAEGEREKVVGEEPNHDHKKAWSSINHSVLSEVNPYHRELRWRRPKVGRH